MWVRLEIPEKLTCDWVIQLQLFYMRAVSQKHRGPSAQIQTAYDSIDWKEISGSVIGQGQWVARQSIRHIVVSTRLVHNGEVKILESQ